MSDTPLFIYAGLSVLTFLLYALLKVRFIKVYLHCDCGALRSPGFFYARKQISRREFINATGAIGNKTFIYYIHLLSYRLFSEKPGTAPIIVYMVYNFLTCVVLFCFLGELCGGEAGYIGVLFFLLISSYSRFYISYESIEKYTFLPIFILYASAWGSSVVHGVLIGILGPVLFFLFKPTYILEWLACVLFYSLSQPHPAGIAAGFFLGIGGIVLFSYTRQGNNFLWEIGSIFKARFYTYWLTYGRSKKKGDRKTGKKETSLQTDKTILKKTRYPFVKPAFLGLSCCLFFVMSGMFSSHEAAIWFSGVFFMAAMGILIQHRFYGYHFLALIPSSVMLGGMGYHSFGHNLWYQISLCFCLIVLLKSLHWEVFSSPEQINRELFGMIEHYRVRNSVAHKISDILGVNFSDTVLTWGDSPQLNLLLKTPSPLINQDVTHWGFKGNPYIVADLLLRCRKKPPAYIIPMIDNINWAYFVRITGLEYKKILAIQEGGESFPVYAFDKRRDIPELENEILEQIYNKATQTNDFGAHEIIDTLFMPCRKITAGGRQIWNHAE